MLRGVLRLGGSRLEVLCCYFEQKDSVNWKEGSCFNLVRVVN